MVPSNYQRERLLQRLRWVCDWLPWPALRRWGGADPVRMSAEAVQAARERAEPPAREAPGPSIAAVRERNGYPSRVEAERERRAGSFMDPPYPDEPPPGIPKVERPATRRQPARDRTAGD